MQASLGPLSSHMLQHIVLMNVVAPLLLLALRPHLPATLWQSWPWAAAVQLSLLWAWHAPATMNAALGSHLLHVAMQGSLFLSALWFWSSLITMPQPARWRGLFSLLVTGKLFCLLGALLIFAGRPIYSAAGHGNGPIALADQELAGLLMIVACPLSYVAAGVVIAARWFIALEESEAHDRTAA